MNRRQKKKQFKRRFGFNPPRSIYGIYSMCPIIDASEKIA